MCLSMNACCEQITLNQLLNCSSQASSGYQSNFTGSSVSLDVNNTSGLHAPSPPPASVTSL